MTEQPENAPPEAADPFIGITADLIDLGRTWAVHGLGLGRQALVSTARTLELTAETLERVAERLRSDAS